MTLTNEVFRMIQFEVEDGEDIKSYTADCYIISHEEHNYGADADGNRGTYAFIIDDVRIEEVYDSEGNDVELTEQMEEIIREKANSADLSY